MNIPFSPPDITELEINEVVDALRSGWITTGPRTKLFEKKIAEYCGTSKAVCLNSNTAAQELVLRRLGVGPGDEVITCAYTYTASASVIHHVGAKIVMVDVVPGTYCIDYDKLADAITERTKVVIPIDIGGVMVDYDKVFAAVESKKHLFKPANDIQATFGRVVVAADAAHSLGASWHGKKSGAVADFTSFSFHAVKNLTTAEGGAITWKDHEGIDNDELYKWFMLYSLHGQSKDALSKMKLGAWEYDIVYPAYKCNMTDVAAAMGIIQLQRFDGLVEKRKHVMEIYDRVLLPLGIERLEHSGEDFDGNGHLYLMRVPGISEQERNDIIVKMAEAGIATNVHFKPLPMHTAYKNLGFDIADYPNSYAQYANEITLPLHTLLTDEEAEYVAETMKSILVGEYSCQIAKENIEFFRVRENEADKIKLIQNMIYACGQEMFVEDSILHMATPQQINVLREECLQKKVYLVKDRQTGRVVATVNTTEKSSPYFDMEKKAMYIDRLTVSPEFWRRGIGTKILYVLEDEARKNGCECLRGKVCTESEAAMAFVEKFGFVELYKRPSRNFVFSCLEKEI